MASRARFIETRGGRIYDRRNGIECATVNVESLATEDAARCVRAVIDGLNREFGETIDTPGKSRR